eukprot:gene1057-394_t
MQDIFGRQDGATKYYGLVDCDTEREVSEKFGNLKSSWDKLEQESTSKTSCTFHEWFEKEKLADLITSMLKPVRIDAGLGNPPTQYTNNDVESAYFVIKHHLQFDAKKPSEFINSIKEIITIQQNDEERAVFNKGPYIPAKRFQHLAVGDDLWGQMTHPQKASHICKFVKADMNTERKERKAAQPVHDIVTPHATQLETTPLEAKLSTVPLPVLEVMFEKANDLLASPGRGSKGASMTAMALEGGPKSAGKKPRNRKKSNKKNETPQKYVDLLANNRAGFDSRQSHTEIQEQGQFCTESNDQNPLQWQQIQLMAQQMAPQMHMNGPAIAPLPHNFREAEFTLKWVTGTTVSRCYGCSGKIINPPLPGPDDIVIVYKDIREYRDRQTGQIMQTPIAQNIHFHMRLA